MSRLEEQVQPVLAPMVRGKSALVSETAQTLMSRWAVKTVMVLEQTGASARPRYYLPGERRALRTGGVIPRTSLIWIGRLNAPAVAAWAREDDLSLTVEQDGMQPTVANGYIATIAAGEIVMVVLSMRLSVSAGAELELTNLAGWTDTVSRIWPAGDEVAWPPAQTLTLESLRAFAQTWTGGA